MGKKLQKEFSGVTEAISYYLGFTRQKSVDQRC